MRSSIRPYAAFFVTLCLLLTPITALAKKGEANFNRGRQYEAAEQWDKAAQEYALAVAADPGDTQYQLHYKRALFNSSQMYMMRGTAMAEQKDYVGAYNAFRQAYGYDPVNELALSEMERMLRLQEEKAAARDGKNEGDSRGKGTGATIAPTSYSSNGNGQPSASGERRSVSQQDPSTAPTGTEQLRVINYSGDLKAFIRSLAEQLNLNVVFDSQSFRQPRSIDLNLRNVTTARALDYLFQQENLFFQKLDRRTILVADQTRRPQYQQLVLRTFYLANADPQDALRLIQQAIPAQAGRPPTIAIPDKATNSLTVRDTAENVALIGELIDSIDKDRAEVVMDVNIYEVSRNDLLQIGNQIGNDGSLLNMGGTSSGIFTLFGSRTAITNGLAAAPPVALGGALLIPASNISFFQQRSHTKLLASTQIHAFTGEESSARIGQRVPVQTAQTYPITTTSGTDTKGSGGVFGSNGFPVINYEPTGLTLKFTPQVFPNLDVQVKMSIESKDVLNPSLTPTFIERTITGTARIQNNRTMMLVSLAQDKQSNGRKGMPFIGLIPILGRLFSTPTRDNQETDIVIAVTPRVLRAPAVTPNDIKERPSGTLQTPTQGSLEAMIEEAEREEQLAEARRTRNNSVAEAVTHPATTPAGADAKTTATEMASTMVTPNEVPSKGISVDGAGAAVKDVAARDVSTSGPEAEPPTYVPAPKSMLPANPTPVRSFSGSDGSESGPTNETAVPTPTSYEAPKKTEVKPSISTVVPRSSNAISKLLQQSSKQHGMQFASGSPVGAAGTLSISVEEPPQLLSSSRLSTTAVPATGFTSIPLTPSTPLSSAAELRLIPERSEMRVTDKRRLALVLKTDAPLGLAVITLRFDPRTVAIRNVATGNLFAGLQTSQPTITQTINPNGMLLVSIAPPTGGSMSGAGVLLFIDIEGLAVGESVITFDKNNMHLIAADGRNLVLQLVQSEVAVKQ
jgi:general secretion pathway protein D